MLKQFETPHAGILENQRLFFSDVELDDSKSLAESGLEEGVVLQLLVQSDIAILVRTVTGRVLSIQVDPHDTVEHLMLQWQKMHPSIQPGKISMVSRLQACGAEASPKHRTKLVESWLPAGYRQLEQRYLLHWDLVS